MGKRWPNNAVCLLALIFVSATPMWGQLEIGNDWLLGLSGNLGYSYNGSIVQGSSSHGQGLFGDAVLRGSFYNPRFLNFSVSPYFGRSQNNNLYGSLGYSEGVGAGVNLFGGSHFPAGIFYSQGNNNTSQYGLPSSTIGLEQHGNNQVFGLSWSELLPGLPTLSANYTMGNTSNEIIGIPGQDKQKTKTFTLLSTYHIDGWNLGGGYSHRNIDTDFTEIIPGSEELPAYTKNASNEFHGSGQHSLPLSGSFSASYSHTNYSYDYRDGAQDNTKGGSNSLTVSAGFNPFRRVSAGTSASYTDSLLDVIPESVNSSTVISLSTGKFRNFIWNSEAAYQPMRNLTINGTVAYARQDYRGITHSSTQYGAGINYGLNHRFLGSFLFSLSAFDYANQYGNNGMGYTANLNFNRKVRGWEYDANLAYLQNVQTLYLVYTTSGYNWVTSVRRHMAHRTTLVGGYGGSHSGFSGGTGNSSSSLRTYATIIWHEYNLNGFYSKADGTAIFTPTGLVTVPGNLPPGVLPSNLVELFGSKAVGANLGGVFKHRLTWSFGYSNASGSSVTPSLDLRTESRLYNAVFQYRMRKIYLDGGFTKVRQSVGTVGTVPVDVTSYYVGFTRWFDFF